MLKERLCNLCDCQYLEDEYHFIFYSETYYGLRRRYIHTFCRTKQSMLGSLVKLKKIKKSEKKLESGWVGLAPIQIFCLFFVFFVFFCTFADKY